MNVTNSTKPCSIYTRMCLLEAPITYIFAFIFIVGIVLATLANFICLLILWRIPRRSRSNNLLMSLAISDFLVGILVFPINASQMLSTKMLTSEMVDSMRIYIAVFLEGSSVLTLAVIALDRYVLMTKMSLYHKPKMFRITVVLIIFAWLFPALAPSLRWVDKALYLYVLTFIFVCPFLILLMSYYFIAKALRDQEKKLQKQYNEFSMEKREDQDEKSKLKSRKNIIKITKAVSSLMFVYFVCITPKNVWMIIFLINDKKYKWEINVQYLYLVAMAAVSYNSCLNPLVYFFKNPEMKRGFRRLFKMQDSSSDSQTFGTSAN